MDEISITKILIKLRVFEQFIRENLTDDGFKDLVEKVENRQFGLSEGEGVKTLVKFDAGQKKRDAQEKEEEPDIVKR